jgi:DNA repair protein RadC
VATKAVWEYSLQRRKTMEMREDQRVEEPAAMAAFLRGLGLPDKEQEYFYVVFLDAKNGIKGYSLVTIGLVDRTQVHAREVFRGAVLQGSSRILLAHNHPSGDCTPSALDIATTRQLVEAGKIVGIEVLDHVIIGQPNATGRDWLSFREQCLM